ncbi:MAG: hypothetical protein Q7K29_05075 [Thermoleophilia bacterium]|nr:hypothetical protein [Thermoleophilia bacterium]
MNCLRLSVVALASLLRVRLAVVALAGLLMMLSGCGLSLDGSRTDLSHSPEFQRYERSHFGFFRALGSYPFVTELDVHWERPHPGPFIWGEVEKTEGTYDWSGIDRYIGTSQDYGIVLVATIWPYANWDQERCHEKLPDTRRLFSILGDYRGKPCDPQAYRLFVEAMVERYDGDGEDDMPGLVYPIKYWEVVNEPDIAEGSLFFKGDPQDADYLEVLAATHDAIGAVDPSAKVLNGGIAYLSDKEKPFWRSILGGPGAEYIDILTIHSITQGEGLQLDHLQALMDELGLDKPVWVTEIQYAKSTAYFQARGIIPDEESEINPTGLHGLTEDEWSALLVRSFVEAFGRGADRLFYLGLDNSTPTEETSLLVQCEVKSGAARGDPFDPALCQRQKPFYAFKTMVEKLDYFDSAEKLAEGQYRFSVDGRSVYVLWGSQPLPEEISGTVTLTDINGMQKETEAGNIILTETPVFIG